MSDEVTMVLERLANLFEMAGETNWTSQQIADVLRRHAIDRDAPLTNRQENDDVFPGFRGNNDSA